MNSSWDISDLIKRLQSRDDDYSQKAVDALEAIIENLYFCRYHYEFFSQLQESHIRKLKGKDDSVHNSTLVRRALRDPEFADSEREFSIACSAHLNALLRCLHSNSDLLSHVVYFALKDYFPSLREKKYLCLK